MTETEKLTQMKALHKQAFPTDSDAYIDEFYSSVPPERRVTVEEDGRVVSMGCVIEKRCRLWDRSERFPYISAVATAVDYRGRGLAARVMSEAMRRLYDSGALFCALKPFSDTYYLRYGFDSVSFAQRKSVVGGLAAERRPCRLEDFPLIERFEGAMRRGYDNCLLFGKEEWDKKLAEFAVDGTPCTVFSRAGEPFAYAFVSDFIEQYATDDIDAFRRCEPLKGLAYYDFAGDEPYVQARVVDARRALLRAPHGNIPDFRCKLRIKDEIIMDNNIEAVYAVTDGTATLTPLRAVETLPEYTLTAAKLTKILLTGGNLGIPRQKNFFPDRY